MELYLQKRGWKHRPYFLALPCCFASLIQLFQLSTLWCSPNLSLLFGWKHAGFWYGKKASVLWRFVMMAILWWSEIRNNKDIWWCYWGGDHITLGQGQILDFPLGFYFFWDWQSSVFICPPWLGSCIVLVKSYFHVIFQLLVFGICFMQTEEVAFLFVWNPLGFFCFLFFRCVCCVCVWIASPLFKSLLVNH